LLVIKGGNHNNTWKLGGETYVNKLRMFIAKNRDYKETKATKSKLAIADPDICDDDYGVGAKSKKA
jgi:hypothetical protein